MISQTISHYKILEKLGEVPIRLNVAFPSNLEKLSSFVELSERLWRHGALRHTPPSVGGSGKWSSGL